MIYFWQEVYNFCWQITHRIGEKLLEDFAKLEATRKSDGSLVTEADKWADSEFRKAIRQCFPTHGILTEETEHILPYTDWCWVIDPIDGTTNFTRGIPIWGISIGLLYQGIPVFGFVHFPQIQQTYHGYFCENTHLSSPKGAYLNNTRIYTSHDQPSFNHVFMLCNRSLDILQHNLPCKIRITGVTSYDIISVACGATLGVIEASPKIWDIAGAYPILRAAGGNLVHLEQKVSFPLTKGLNYGEVSFPCLAVARDNLIPIFQPFTEFINKKELITHNQ
ncbi:MAG: inositol monophosphatase [Cyanobacteria bacterium]|nr:inositol monophosphatase [Cyanobacteria bacterium CG_2015-16_32_12]NCO78382.1 inositol monophosphatase [Cyanobacteria bacterium CG_2015-22_32_23]NCQ02951.1 inositol monophosphatase [Cyanobacteria bacterium CG_2015-09_32_10]NCQ41842.1 inositol monophosphatase [Cyanobacteria bacterium CG_2015-04_32_10]NCS85883.1 inositol monophosphatase [Cyanobacteria bacterium CG_2015-02_32_10]